MKFRQKPSLHDFCLFNLNQGVIGHYHRITLSRILSLHPMLEENTLQLAIESFMKKYSPSEALPLREKARDLSSITSIPLSTKRQRSHDDPEINVSGSPSPFRSLSPNSKTRKPLAPVVSINRTLDNAIVLLVFALGAICSWKSHGMPGSLQILGPLLVPSPYAMFDGYTDTFDAMSSTSSSSLDSSAMFVESPSLTHMPDFTDSKKRKRGTDLAQSSTYQRTPRNLDIIPGMAYFSHATDILSSFSGSTSLRYTQACLLAGMYAAQIAHPFTTHAWIQQACRACKVLIQS